MNNRVLTLLRGARSGAGESQQTVPSPTPELSAELGRWACPRRIALRPLGFVLLAVVLSLGALLLAHQSSQAQTAQGEEVEAWLPIPYPRNENLTPPSRPEWLFTDAELDALLDKAASAGVDGVEIQADWWILEPVEDQYEWANYTDRFVREARERGLKVAFQITEAPPWARQSGGDYGGWDPPRSSAELAAWSDFISDMVNRYGTQVTRYKMWNEPNLTTFWKPGPKPSEYAALLRTGYMAAKAANPNVTVTCCSLSNNDVGYLNALYGELRKYPDAAANDDFFDELSVHPYSNTGNTQVAPDSTENLTYQGAFGTKNNNFWGYRYMRDLMVSRGDAHKKILLGEFGYATKPGWATPITDEQRATWLKKAFEIANQDASYLSGLDWYSYYTDAERGFNLVDPDTLAESATFKALREVAGGGRSYTRLAHLPGRTYRLSGKETNRPRRVVKVETGWHCAPVLGAPSAFEPRPLPSLLFFSVGYVPAAMQR